ncbi:hypothetical protein QVL81_35365, partial [Klebsiella pneumoniae]|nr:hypothetical protein [Klebsiella pneumoniae]
MHRAERSFPKDTPDMKEIALPLHPAPARVWIAVVAL